MEFVIAKFNYWMYIVLMMVGLYAMISKRNLVKKLIGMSIFQTAIILFYVSIGVKTGGTIPIPLHHASVESARYAVTTAAGPVLELMPAAQAKPKAETGHPAAQHEGPLKTGAGGHAADTDVGHGEHHGLQAKDYNNPLPHVLMLTAIVVGVATLGVGLAVLQKIYLEYGSAEEHVILSAVKRDLG